MLLHNIIQRHVSLWALIALICATVLLGVPEEALAYTVVDTLSVGDAPWGVGVNPNTNMVYVANCHDDTVSVINGASNTVVDTVSVGDAPVGVGVNSNTNAIYVANGYDDTVSVIDGDSNTVVDTVSVGDDPSGVGVNPETNRVYVANISYDNISVINGASNTVVDTVSVGDHPWGVGVNTNTNIVYVANRNDDTVSVIDGASNSVVDTVSVGDNPFGVGVNPNTNMVYVGNRNDIFLSVIDGTSNTIVDTVMCNVPYGVDVNPDKNLVYVATIGDDTVSVIDCVSNSVVDTVGVGDDPFDLGVNPDTNMVYVSNWNDDTVSVIDCGSEPTPTITTWYLAEGTTDWGFDCYISIENPGSEQVGARVTYMTKDGPQEKPEITLPASSQTTINPRDDLGNTDFSTKVECTTEGKTIAVDRTMSWTGPGAPSPDGHCSVGVTSPEKTWYLPEGSSDWGFECWLLIQNPNDSEATAQVTYMIEGKGPQAFEKKVPANSRASFNMADDIGAEDASIKVVSDLPVIPERAMYRNNRREGHDSIGTTTPATDYYLAEGTTDWGFTTYVLVQNPNDTPTDVTVTYMTGAGPVPQGSFTMEPNSRKTIRVNDVLPGEDLSTRVSGSQPIIAERAMYWDNGTGEACHDSIGMDSPHTTFYLPDGETSNGRETWTLVANPNEGDVTVEVTYLTPDGQGNPTFTDTVPANSRKTYNMADAGIQGRAAVMVTSKTPDKKIMVERAMYWNNRGAGTDTIGGYGD